MCIIISIQDGSICLSNSVEMMSNLQDVFFIDIISFLTSSIVRDATHLNCGMSLICGLNSSILGHSSLIFLYFFQWEIKQIVGYFFIWFISSSGFDGLLLVMLLTTENSCFESFLQSSFFLVMACHLCCAISLLYMFLSGIGCPVVRLPVLVPCPLLWSYYLLLVSDVFVEPWLFRFIWILDCFSGAILSSAFSSLVLNWWHAWLRESLLSMVGALKLASKASPVILVLSLIVFFI